MLIQHLLLFTLPLTQALFSIHDDILAFPQYEIQFPESYMTEEDASSLLAPPPSSSIYHSSPHPKPTDSAKEEGDTAPTYEALWLGDRRYLCSVPVVDPPPPLNATEKELSRAAEEKELARATVRGWELLKELEGECLYFISGWWSYSFCHNREVRQFHQLPPQSPKMQWPPTEDPATPSYVLGQVAESKRSNERGEGTGLQTTGDLRFLVQKIGGGTVCDLTGKERKIEIQFHCNSQGPDRIGWIKEVSICCYLMVVYTSRLCKDIAFHPPRENHANLMQCWEIMNPARVIEWTEEQEKRRIEWERAEKEQEPLRLLEKEVEEALRSVLEMGQNEAEEDQVVMIVQQEL
ncbi:Protein OS-9 [Rhizina undulata]